MRESQPSIPELSAEFAGTLLLMLFGLGVEAQVATAVPVGSMGNHDSITWAWGLGVTIACYIAARLSGAHLNPAVTLALAVCNGFPWRKVAGYCAAQMAGATVAAVIVRLLYHDLIAHVDPDFTAATQTVFSTNPGAGVSLTTALFDQVLGTAILVFAVCALTSASNNPPLANTEPVVVGLLVVAIGMAWGANAGYAINPARDLPPRLVSWLTGYETAWVDPAGDQYWWVPVVGPLVGGVVGAWLFKMAIGRFLTAQPAGVDPFADSDPRNTVRVRLAEQLTTARGEAAMAAQQARLAAERAQEMESGYLLLAARAAAQGWSGEDRSGRQADHLPWAAPPGPAAASQPPPHAHHTAPPVPVQAAVSQPPPHAHHTPTPMAVPVGQSSAARPQESTTTWYRPGPLRTPAPTMRGV